MSFSRSNVSVSASLWLALSIALLLSALYTAAAQSGVATPPTVLSLDATAAAKPLVPADYKPGSDRAPDGQTIGVTERYVTRNGQPWLPVMGEFHFSRVPADEWEVELLKMKAAGVDIVSAYIIWIHHEEVRGQWDWTGQRDLHQFAALCAKHHMLLLLRIGPWVHGETRNGGLPDWVLKAGPTRETDPTFMNETAAFYAQIAQQVHGMMWKDGGPVVGIQLDNEYVQRGPRQGEDYIMALKKLAVADGMDVPLYTITGWGNAPLPRGEVLPVFGGYPDAPWGNFHAVLPPAEVYAFRFGSRETSNMGLIGAAGAQAAGQSAMDAKTPFFTAEMGGGMQSTYHRRITVSADDIAAMMPVMLGSGVNLYGTYMFHGGQNPDGVQSTLQESQDTGYPSDLPVKSYDFQSPIGEYGLEKPSLNALKQWNYLLNDFGAMLAPMPAYHPDTVPTGPEDLKPVRWSVRTDGKAGFLFLNNYVRESAMPERRHLQFSIKLPGGTTNVIPAKPIDIPGGAYFVWPFGLDFNGTHLRYATAQLLMKLEDNQYRMKKTLVFACLRKVRCELAVEGGDVQVEPRMGVTVDHLGDVTTITAETARPKTQKGLKPAAIVRDAQGRTTNLLLLSPEEASDAWKIGLEGSQHLLETKAEVFEDGDRMTLLQLGNPAFSWRLYPSPVGRPKATAAVQDDGMGGFSAAVAIESPKVEITKTRPASIAPPIHNGPRSSVPQLPEDAVWSSVAAQWAFKVTGAHLSADVDNLFLKVEYVADAARLQGNGRLLADEFYSGEPWLVGLRRYRSQGDIPPLQLDLLPLRNDSPIYLPAAARPTMNPSVQTVKLSGIRVIPEYKLTLEKSATR